MSARRRALKKKVATRAPARRIPSAPVRRPAAAPRAVKGIPSGPSGVAYEEVGF